jgi:hypothetical protein
VTRDKDVISLSLGNTAGNDTDTNLRDELDRDSGTRVSGLGIINELLKILNGVDIVVRRRRNETNSRGRVTSLSNLV